MVMWSCPMAAESPNFLVHRCVKVNEDKGVTRKAALLESLARESNLRSELDNNGIVMLATTDIEGRHSHGSGSTEHADRTKSRQHTEWTNERHQNNLSNNRGCVNFLREHTRTKRVHQDRRDASTGGRLPDKGSCSPSSSEQSSGTRASEYDPVKTA